MEASFSPAAVEETKVVHVGADIQISPMAVMERPGTGTAGQFVKLSCNYFTVDFFNPRDLYCYNVTITAYSNHGYSREVWDEVLRRKIMKKIEEIFRKSKLDGKLFAYDGKNRIVTTGPLCRKKIEFVVVLEKCIVTEEDGQKITQLSDVGGEIVERKRRRINEDIAGRKFKVEIACIAHIYKKTLQSITKGSISYKTGALLMVLQSLLRQHASWKYQGYLLLRRNVFHWDFAHLVEPGGNPGGCRGYRCSFRPTQKGISLIMDISTTYKYPRQSSTRNIEPLRKSLVEECILEPEERLTMLTKANDANDYNSDPFFSGYKMKVDKQLMTLNGRILHPPELRFGQRVEETPKNGGWNFLDKTMIQAAAIRSWAIVNFGVNSQLSDLKRIAWELRRCCTMKGMVMSECGAFIQERIYEAATMEDCLLSVERMVQQMGDICLSRSDFLLCILPKRSCIYGPLKRKLLCKLGVLCQCISHDYSSKIIRKRMSDEYLSNLTLKINLKMGGINTALAVELAHGIPKISEQPTLIIGMGVWHASPGFNSSDTPSLAAVASSREWPLISKYKVSLRTQAKSEMIENLYNPVPQGGDSGIINELLKDFCRTCKSPAIIDIKPKQVIIFRNGVSQSQFDRVLNVELQDVLKACNDFEHGYKPKVTFIVVQKSGHTKLFHNTAGNVQPGTIVDTHICHPRNFDFYLCAQAAMYGTSRPSHYHVLLDENEFSTNDLQILVHNLSYVYQRSTTAISSVAPLKYAHLAATQMRKILRAKSETAISEAEIEAHIPQLHEKIRDTMFFC